MATTGDIIFEDGTVLTPTDLEKLLPLIVEKINSTAKDPGQYPVAERIESLTSIPVFDTSFNLKRALISALKGNTGATPDITFKVSSLPYGSTPTTDKTGTPENPVVSIGLPAGKNGEKITWRSTATGIEVKYEEEPDSSYQTLFTFAEVMPDVSDFSEEGIKELQRPATEAAASATAKVEELTADVAAAIEGATTATAAANIAAENANLAAENVQDGKTPVFQTGTTTTVLPDVPASLSLEADGVDESGNPIYKTNAQIPQGAIGPAGSDFIILGYYNTFADLTAAVTHPSAGDAYGIGLDAPYSIYVWDGVNNIWVDNGPLQGPAGVSGKSARVNTEKNVWQVFNDATGQWEDTDYIVQYSVATDDLAGLMSAADFRKLGGIQEGAEVNVQPDWNVTDSASDAYIQNKPALKPVATSGSYNDLENKPTEINASKFSEGLKNNGLMADWNDPPLVNGLAWSNSTAANAPSWPYGNVLQISNKDIPEIVSDWSWINQILFGTDNNIYHRTYIHSTGWAEYKRLAHADEIPNLGNLASNIKFTNTHATDGTKIGLSGTAGGSDCWSITTYSTAEDGEELEIATGDNGNEPIVARQYYSDPISTPPRAAVRTAYILDEKGNTIFPGDLDTGGVAKSGGVELVKTNDARLSDARYPLSVAIERDADLNNYTTPGFYHCLANTTVATLKNCPTANAFSLRVEHTAYLSCIQFLSTFNVNTALLYYRTIYRVSAEVGYSYGVWQRIYTTYDTPPIATTSANGLMAAADKSFVDYFRGYNHVTSLVNLPLNKRTILCDLSAASNAFSLNGTPESGIDYLIIIHNISSSPINQSVYIGSNDSTVYFGGNTITIPAGGYYEISLLCINGNSFFLRSGGQ